ncbi:MAG: sodium:solute symporter family protein [Candidatus Melainabacteria bacterium]
MAPLDILVICSYLFMAIYTGLRSHEKATTNLEEYFLAGRSIKGWQAGLSMAAAQFAADTPLLVTGLIATMGIFSLWRLWIYGLAFLVLGFLLGPSWRNVGVITDAELTEVRYGQKPAMILRGFKAVYLGTIFNCTVLAMVLLAATRIAEPFMKWNEWLPAAVFTPIMHLVQMIGEPLTISLSDPSMIWVYSTNNIISIVTIAMVTTFYSATGGLRNVIKMDIFQFFVVMLGTAVYAFFVIKAAGGMQAIPAQLHALYGQSGMAGMTPDQILAFTPGEAKGVTFMVIGLMLIQWIAQINADGSGYLAQRTMACRSDADAKQASIVFTVVQIIFRTLLWLPIGLGLLLVFPPDPAVSGELFKAQREATYVLGMSELLPPGVKGLMITAMLAALGSTVDTHINWGASYWTNDIYKRIICQGLLKREPSGKSLVWVARLSNVMILMLALLIMSRLSSIQVAWQASLLLGAGLGGVLLLRWFWWRINAWGEIATILTSLVLAPVMLFAMPLELDAERMILLALISTVIGIVTSLLTSQEKIEQLQIFYKKASPPGFWGPVAASLGMSTEEPKHRFYQGLASVLVCGLSVFSTLIGAGSWICGSPAPIFADNPMIWNLGCLIVGLGLIPVWYPMVFGGTIGYNGTNKPAGASS